MGDKHLPEPTDPAAEGPQDPGTEGGDNPPEPTGIAAALAKARETLAAKGTMVPEGDEPADDDGPADEPDDEGGDDEGDEPDEEEGDEADEADEEEEEDEPDDEPDEEEEEEPDDDEDDDDEEEEGDEPKTFTAKLPGRHPGDPDVEIEVEDQALAERINQLRNAGMRREQFEAAMVEIQGAQDELAQIEEQFTIDPAGFVLDNIDEESAPTVALALLTDPKIWKDLQPTLVKLLDDPQELRTLQAEAKAARLETKDKLKQAAQVRKQQTENARAITQAIDLMVPEALGEDRRASLIRDLTRDIKDHIDRNKLQSLDAKDLPTIVADRLQLNGIDPLDARKAIKDGKRSRSEPSTKKRPKGKPKSGKSLVKASVKRKKAAAAPGPGRKAAPTEPKKLPAGQTIKDRIAAVRKEGLGAFLGDR